MLGIEEKLDPPKLKVRGTRLRTYHFVVIWSSGELNPFRLVLAFKNFNLDP
jgi:hypothetical protein